MEVNYDKIDAPRGMDITIVTSAKDDLTGKALLDAFGFPFRKGEMPASTKRVKKQLKKKSVVQGNS
jgi:large subunit ribosomal protein L5